MEASATECCRLCKSKEDIQHLVEAVTLRLESGDLLCTTCLTCVFEMMAICKETNSANVSTQTEIGSQETNEVSLPSYLPVTPLHTSTPFDENEAAKTLANQPKKVYNATNIDEQKALLLGAIKKG